MAQQLLLSLAISLVSGSAVLAAELDALDRPAIASELGAKSYLLDIARAGEHIVAVGERGLALVSEDEGKSWRQALVPVSVTLTAVEFADEGKAFIVGHGGSVLTSDDSGDNWSLSLDGKQIAELTLQTAKASADEELIAYAQRMITDGPDKPLLDLLVVDRDNVLVVGAYGIVMRTEDAGETWSSQMDRIDNPLGLHIYSIADRENRIAMAGEQGMVWLSRDNGESFEVLETPYFGSFFTVELLGQQQIVVAGLRGNVWQSIDNGENWMQLSAPAPVTINASLVDSNGLMLMVNQSGNVLQLDGENIKPLTSKPLPPLNSILALANGSLLMASQRGIASIDSVEFDKVK